MVMEEPGACFIGADRFIDPYQRSLAVAVF